MRNLLEWMEENADSPSSWFRKDMAVALGLSIDRISDLLEKLYERFGVDGMDALRAAILNKVRDQRPWVPADERTHEGT